jgi:membrane fusion protein, multidrug efflux system
MSNTGQVEEIKNPRKGEVAPAGDAPTPQTPAPADPPPLATPASPPASPTAAQAQPAGGKGRALFHRPGVVLFVMLLVVAGIIFAATVMLKVLTHESTDDAFIDGHVILIAPKISGKVAHVNVTDNQEVTKGDTLLEIDPSDYQSVVDQKQAAYDVADAKEKAAEDAVIQSQAHVKTLLAGMASLQASADASKLAADLSHSDLNRDQPLIKTGVVSAQDFEHAKSAAYTADANLLAKVKEVDATLA